MGCAFSTVGLVVTMGASAIDDYYHIEIDGVNKPARPLPSGLPGLYAFLTDSVGESLDRPALLDGRNLWRYYFGRHPPSVLPAVLVFLPITSRATLKTGEDHEGTRILRPRPFPLHLGGPLRCDATT